MRNSLPTKLAVLNLLRWFREYAVSWGLLSLIYSCTVTLILQSVLEVALKREIAFGALWAATCALLLVPGVLQHLPLPPLSRLGTSLFSRDPLGRVYLRHEFRRGATWFSVAVTVLIGALLPAGQAGLWVLVTQLPLQRALYSIQSWRTLAVAQYPKSGAPSLIGALARAQVFQALVCWLAWGALARPTRWLELGAAALGAVISGSATAMEGDSGRPWMVNFIALAAGTLGGYLCLASPAFLLLVFYFADRVRLGAGNRLLSVEHLDEDTLIP